MDVVLDKQPTKYLERLTQADKRRIAIALTTLSLEPPQGDIVRLTDKDNEYRLRVGERRLLYKIEERITANNTAEKYIVVYKITSRGQAYKE